MKIRLLVLCLASVFIFIVWFSKTNKSKQLKLYSENKQLTIDNNEIRKINLRLQMKNENLKRTLEKIESINKKY